MDPFPEKPRRLLVFAPAAEDARLLRQRELLSGAAEGLSDRDLRVEYLTGDRAAPARREYGVAADVFAALLVGRDGGVKRRYPELVASDELFGHVDEMPLRRREMREAEEGREGRGEGP
ncbi:DUF4174 domain-containing protein [Rubrobacter aplysinae]|uniref:DUF4174 domain-containing protein n=1 Tax=Rubrobacter aplysinae TaxID=909625 RepID=UPI00389A4D0B